MRSSEPWFAAGNRWDTKCIWPQGRVVELSLEDFKGKEVLSPFPYITSMLIWSCSKHATLFQNTLTGRSKSLRAEQDWSFYFKSNNKKKKFKRLNQWELLEMQLIQAWNAKLWLAVNYSKICQKSLKLSTLLSFNRGYMAVHRLQMKRYKYFVLTNSHHPAIVFY